MLLEGLPREDLGEDVGGIVLGTYVCTTVMVPAPRISRSLNCLRSMCREF